MSRTMVALRSLTALLLIALGLVIVGRGVIGGAPFSFTAMGALMAGLGIYRIRLLRGRGRQR